MGLQASPVCGFSKSFSTRPISRSGFEEFSAQKPSQFSKVFLEVLGCQGSSTLLDSPRAVVSKLGFPLFNTFPNSSGFLHLKHARRRPTQKFLKTYRTSTCIVCTSGIYHIPLGCGVNPVRWGPGRLPRCHRHGGQRLQFRVCAPDQNQKPNDVKS